MAENYFSNDLRQESTLLGKQTRRQFFINSAKLVGALGALPLLGGSLSACSEKDGIVTPASGNSNTINNGNIGSGSGSSALGSEFTSQTSGSTSGFELKVGANGDSYIPKLFGTPNRAQEVQFAEGLLSKDSITTTGIKTAVAVEANPWKPGEKFTINIDGVETSLELLKTGGEKGSTMVFKDSNGIFYKGSYVPEFLPHVKAEVKMINISVSDAYDKYPDIKAKLLSQIAEVSFQIGDKTINAAKLPNLGISLEKLIGLKDPLVIKYINGLLLHAFNSRMSVMTKSGLTDLDFNLGNFTAVVHDGHVIITPIDFWGAVESDITEEQFTRMLTTFFGKYKQYGAIDVEGLAKTISASYANRVDAEKVLGDALQILSSKGGYPKFVPGKGIPKTGKIQLLGLAFYFLSIYSLFDDVTKAKASSDEAQRSSTEIYLQTGILALQDAGYPFINRLTKNWDGNTGAPDGWDGFAGFAAKDTSDYFPITDKNLAEFEQNLQSKSGATPELVLRSFLLRPGDKDPNGRNFSTVLTSIFLKLGSDGKLQYLDESGNQLKNGSVVILREYVNAPDQGWHIYSGTWSKDPFLPSGKDDTHFSPAHFPCAIQNITSIGFIPVQ